MQSSTHGYHEKSLKTRLSTARDVSNNMTEVFFLCQNFYGNTGQINFSDI